MASIQRVQTNGIIIGFLHLSKENATRPRTPFRTLESGERPHVVFSDRIPEKPAAFCGVAPSLPPIFDASKFNQETEFLARYSSWTLRLPLIGYVRS